jgi:hypothetical protein
MAKSAVVAQRQNHYILLILTDGYVWCDACAKRQPFTLTIHHVAYMVRSIISDMRETTREIVRASILPLSIG